jgi:hypothetical protein
LALSAWLTACGSAPPVDGDGGRQLLTRVQAEGYRDWSHAPGWETRKPSMKGGHGGQLDIYVNDTFAAAITAGEPVRTWPIGSTIVKEVWMSDTLRYIDILDKRSDGWYWDELDADGTILAAGHPDGCTNCHGSGVDYVRAFDLP